jgi:hypothetical protein
MKLMAGDKFDNDKYTEKGGENTVPTRSVEVKRRRNFSF